ncbi:hypothetical protein U1Q18_016546 [Sarracenia purpurea var. burkii]
MVELRSGSTCGRDSVEVGVAGSLVTVRFGCCSPIRRSCLERGLDLTSRSSVEVGYNRRRSSARPAAKATDGDLFVVSGERDRPHVSPARFT